MLAKAAFFAMFLAVAVVAQAPERSPFSGLELHNFDRTVRPQDDLFRFVNGGWLDRTSIPGDRVTYGAFAELSDRIEADIRDIIEETIAAPERSRTAKQIVDLYTSLMDAERIEARGIEPVRPQLAKIAAIRSIKDLAQQAGYLSAIAAGGPFPGSVEDDPDTPGKLVVRIAQGGILLPDRDYYLKPDARYAAYRERYARYLTSLFSLADWPDSANIARAVVALESEIASILWTQDQMRDRSREPRTYTVAALGREMPGFDWNAWARPQGIDRVGTVVLMQPSFFSDFSALAARTPIESWKAWLAARYLTACAPYLTRGFSDLRFEFFGRELTGQEVPRTNWKRGVGLVNTILGDAVGRLYVAKHLTPKAKAQVETIVSSIVQAFRAAIGEATWLSDPARRAALDKLGRLTTKVGHPERWRDYGGLVIKTDDLFGNVERSKQFENAYKLARSTSPADPREWLVTPQTTNAYYSAARNEVVVPAGVLRPPIFQADADDAINYGTIGAIVGHEIAHAFDDNGRRFDGRGAPRNWWSPEDERAFLTIATAIFAQSATQLTIDEREIGSLTLRENINDLAGLSVAWRAYRTSLAGRPSPVIDGFTGEQRFFLGWAQVWRGRIRDEYLRQTLATVPYAPSDFRANNPARNLDAFYTAFSVGPADRMFLAVERRVRVY